MFAVSPALLIPVSSLVATYLWHFEGNFAESVVNTTNLSFSSAYNQPTISAGQAKFGIFSSLHSAAGEGAAMYTGGISSTNFDLWTSIDATVDFWIRPITNVTSRSLFNVSSGSGNGTVLRIESGVLILRRTIASAGSVLLTGTISIALNTWTHIAWCRAAGIDYLFVNGVLDVSGAVANQSFGSIGFYIGNRYNGEGFNNGSTMFMGNLDELRLIKGRAAWTSGFTPEIAAYTN